MKHRLDPLLRPRSVAVVGASARENSMGWWSLVNLERGGFAGPVYPVNPGHDKMRSLRCYKQLADLPEIPELVVFAVGDQRIEQALDDAVALTVPAAVVMSALYIDDDSEPLLRERMRRKIHDSGMLVCGANGMGFYNFRDHVWGTGFDSCMHPDQGNVALISHSGSGMSGIVDCEARLRFNFAVSTGNELSVTMDQYLDFALELPETKVVGLFIETARNPQGFRAALEKAQQKQIPVVAIKVGRTEKSAELAVSHSGAMAGDDSTYKALFDHYGVHRVSDMDEMATALILFAELNPIGEGGLVTLHDSGGERQLMVDLADETGVPMAELTADTVSALETVLDPELPAVNPLDGWSRGGAEAAEQMTDCMTIMMQDPGAAIGGIIHDRAPGGLVYPSYVQYMERAHEESGKPVALVASRQGTGSDPLVLAMTHNGLPVIDGVLPFLRGVRGLMNYRDFLKRPPPRPVAAPETTVRKWRERLTEVDSLDEAESLALLRDFGIEANMALVADTEDALMQAAGSLGYPLVLKTAMPGMQHKSEQNGVFLDIRDDIQLIAIYNNLRERLGPRVLLAPLAGAGVEMILGARRDPQFGPVIMFGFGGVLAEVLGDVVFALPPFDAECARRRLNELKLESLLQGVRGMPPADISAFCTMAASFSAMVDALRHELQEVDINPVIAGAEQCIAVDALIIGRANKNGAKQ
jgi:acyl-CoA synthetase (NDP forming)